MLKVAIRGNNFTYLVHPNYGCFAYNCRNCQKKTKKTRYEREEMMAMLLKVSHVGEYIGGQGMSDITDDDNDIYADLEDEHQQNLGGGSGEAGDSPVIGDSRPLLVLFDCETTGFSIQSDESYPPQ